MTKLRIASDFHLEFYSDYKSMRVDNGRDWHTSMFLKPMDDEKEQTLLLAGDILTAARCEFNNYDLLFRDLSERFKAVYIIMGNHEHYKYNFNRTADTLRAFYGQWKNIFFLDNDYAFLDDDTVLYGATMWTDFDKGTDFVAMNAARMGMPDFNIISYGAEDDLSPMTHFTPQHSQKEHAITMVSMNEFWELEEPNKIVMTHHSPSFYSTALQFKGSTLNPAFASNMDNYILEHNPLVWIHGHMHNNSDYMIGDTRVICNPYGYHKENKEYISDLVLDIPTKV